MSVKKRFAIECNIVSIFIPVFNQMNSFLNWNKTFELCVHQNVLWYLTNERAANSLQNSSITISASIIRIVLESEMPFNSSPDCSVSPKSVLRVIWSFSFSPLRPWTKIWSSSTNLWSIAKRERVPVVKGIVGSNRYSLRCLWGNRASLEIKDVTLK